MLGAALFSLFTLACQGPMSGASPVHQNLPGDLALISASEDIPILVPDVTKIDSASLKAVGADKFLSLWYIFVQAEKLIVSDEPATFLIPLNSGLPKDATFLVDRIFTMDVLLNHVTIGDVIDASTASAGEEVFYSLADSELIFTQSGGDTFVNGIRLTGDEFLFGNIKVYVVENYVPFLDPEFFDFVADIPEEKLAYLPAPEDAANLVDSDILRTRQSGDKDISLNDTSDLETSSAATTTSTFVTQSLPTKPTSRPTRFDKFKDRESNESAKNEKKTIKEKDALLFRQSTATTDSAVTSPSVTTESVKSTLSSSVVNVVNTDEAVELSFANLSIPTVNVFEKLFADEGQEALELTNNNSKQKSENIIADPEFGEFLGEIYSEFGDESPSAGGNSTFFSSLMAELDKSNSLASEFVHHFRDAHLDTYLEPYKNYTIIVPTNDAFYDFYPIDWGFNPFLVENFTKDALLNHIMEGDIHLQMFNDGVEIQTIAGRTIKVTKDKEGKLIINGNVIPPEMEVELSHGRLYYIDQMLFVDYSRVNALREQYPWLETAPLLSFPWPSSPFLSHLLQRLQENNNTKLFAHLVRNSDISHLVSSSDENLNRLTYTAFVPNDEALQKAFGGAQKVAVLDHQVINNFLLDHVVSGYLFKDDFEEGFNLLTLSNSALPIKMANESIMIGPAMITEPEQYIYNLGAVFVTDKPFKAVVLTGSNDHETRKLIDDLEIVPLPQVSAKENVSQLKDLESKKGSLSSVEELVSVTEPEVQYEVRTEISYSRRINDGEIEPVPREVLERAKVL